MSMVDAAFLQPCGPLWQDGFSRSSCAPVASLRQGAERPIALLPTAGSQAIAGRRSFADSSIGDGLHPEEGRTAKNAAVPGFGMCALWLLGLRYTATVHLRGRSARASRWSSLRMGPRQSRLAMHARGGEGAAAMAAPQQRELPGIFAPCVVDKILKPVALTMVASFFLYPTVAEGFASTLDKATLSLIQGDVSQFMQNFFNYNGLLFSFFASTTYSFLYQQQENCYVALYSEVAQARSLLEQLTLVTQGRPNYPAVVKYMRDYVSELILGIRFGCPPSVLVAAKPANDPLESLLYLTSVGLPSVVYDSVRGLRQARGERLGQIQQKLPDLHFTLLYILAGLELAVFPMLGGGISTWEPLEQLTMPGHVLLLQSLVFAFLSGAVLMTLRIIEDLRVPTGGLYSISSSLDEMAGGLRMELDRRWKSIPPEAVELALREDPLFARDGEIDLLSDSEEADFQAITQKMRSLPPFARNFWQATTTLDEQTRKRVADAIVVCDEEFCEVPENTMQDKLWDSLTPVSEQAARVLPLKIAAVAAFGFTCGALYPFAVQAIQAGLSNETLLSIREDNAGQWLQNAFTGVGFIFSLFVAQTFAFLYGQQEEIYLALYAEVAEAKALLEQVTLVARARGEAYGNILRGMQDYIKNDLLRFDLPPAQLLSNRGGALKDGVDPLESILYQTSVGLPSGIYETVRTLRSCRGVRLGAVQRKLPDAHFVLLFVLGVLELLIFPVLSAGCAALEPADVVTAPGHILFFHAVLFGIMCSAVALTLIVIVDLVDPVSETYNVRGILVEMVSGLEQELQTRLDAMMKFEALPADKERR
eukprot:TRINITY_DN41716_c0_g2_i1.p1 TRINITY_DN41716_c0_g2~~TRINITY_DN41716_c0_g2_i1.p1  ORF type:complete len:820 (+),score=179.47 TRINITY_DN41716_c0_g2_i1:71-2530(+)